MSERDDLLSAIAATIKDYRAGELAEPTPEHVDRWIKQFEKENQLPLLRELCHVFSKTYFSKEFVSQFFANQIDHRKLTGDNPCEFWKRAHFLEIQENGQSQLEIKRLFGSALFRQCKIKMKDCGAKGGAFIYLDDVLFSGGRVGNDISKWIKDEAPVEAVVHILVIATHQLGEWQCLTRLKKAAADAKKKIEIHCWAAAWFENRKSYRDRSEVLWPTDVPNDALVQAYVAEESKFPFEPRKPGGNLELNVFSSEEGRQLLEHQFLVAGVKIRNFSQNPKPILRPLGFSPFGLGFGSMIVTYRNCPNNSPLALWWGDPNAAPGHPFKKWYPLVPRKTYAPEVEFDDLDI